MELKELILLYTTISGFYSYLPQIRLLLKCKSAKEFSFKTWAIWFINSSLYLLYLMLDDVNIYLKLTQILEVSLIGITAILVCYYKYIKVTKGEKL